MRWIEEAPRLPLQPIAALAGRVPALAALAEATAAASPSIAIAVGSSAQAAVLEHLGQYREERGGLLLGEVFAAGDDPARSRAVLVTQAIAAAEFAGTGISLRMASGVWDLARERLGPLELVVGWYHSHPGLGAFFSATDRRTQAAFFPHAYSVGWVVDPASGESAWFVGRDSVACERVLYGVAGTGVTG